MENMIRVERDGTPYRVFFTINHEQHDFENIRVRDASGESLLTLRKPDIEALKDIIAEEIILATTQLTAMYGMNQPPMN